MKKEKDSEGRRQVDEYLAHLPQESRRALEQLRQTISDLVPDATELISYQIPTFKLNNRMLASYAGFQKHCSFFPGAGPIAAHEKELKSFVISKGTIRFTPEKPLSASLVKKLIKTKIKLDTERRAKRAAA